MTVLERTIQAYTTDSDSWLHSLWHVLGAAAAGVALYLV